jgi:integrase/recombinase XerD
MKTLSAKEITMTMLHFFRRSKTLSQFHDGPLSPYMDSFAERLFSEGYTRLTARQMIRAVAQFSVWLKEQNILSEPITFQHVQLYPRGRIGTVGPALRHLIRFVKEIQPTVVVDEHKKDSPGEQITNEYFCYLDKDRGLSPGTQRYYLHFAEQFLKKQFPKTSPQLAALKPADIIHFIQKEVIATPPSRAAQLTVAMRSFLRFAQSRGMITTNLSDSVPYVAHWRMASLPKYLSNAQVKLVLQRCNRQSIKGKRDYAILLLLARLGLRAGEVAALTLDSINWQAGVVTVQGKGRRTSQFPLFADIGEALADYIKNGRPCVTSRMLFFRSLAPAKPLHGEAAISSIVKSALERAHVNLPSMGAHVFRHTLASEMLRQGGSLTEISQILRHQSIDATTVYAKVDLAALRSIAPAWPGGVL